MNVRKFRASSIRAAMDQVKATLGPEAVILTTREIRRGKSPLVEISAAVDHEPEGQPLPGDGAGELEGGWFMPDPELIRGMQTELREMRVELGRLRTERAMASRSTDQWDRLMEELKELGRVMGVQSVSQEDEAACALVTRLVAGGVEAGLARSLVAQAAHPRPQRSGQSPSSRRAP